MRIIGGMWRSRRLAMPPPSRTRPMPDRIREAIFDILASHFGLPGMVPPFEAADLFAGSGSMGLEAVSRGAAGCDFFERNRSALDVLRDNLDGLAADPRCRIVRADAWTAPLSKPRSEQAYGLIFVDPPFADARDTAAHGRVCRLLDDLYRAHWADETTVIVLHHEKRVEFTAAEGAAWVAFDHRVYGGAGVTFVRGRSGQQ